MLHPLLSNFLSFYTFAFSYSLSSFYLQIKCWTNIEIKKKKQLSLPSRLSEISILILCFANHEFEISRLTSIEIRQVTKSRKSRNGNDVNRRKMFNKKIDNCDRRVHVIYVLLIKIKKYDYGG